MQMTARSNLLLVTKYFGSTNLSMLQRTSRRSLTIMAWNANRINLPCLVTIACRPICTANRAAIFSLFSQFLLSRTLFVFCLSLPELCLLHLTSSITTYKY